MDGMVQRAKMVVAMEYIARQINDESVFDGWLMCGVADGEIAYGDFDYNKVDPYYLDDDNFRDLMDLFLSKMTQAKVSGGLFCDTIVTEQG